MEKFCWRDAEACAGLAVVAGEAGLSAGEEMTLDSKVEVGGVVTSVIFGTAICVIMIFDLVILVVESLVSMQTFDSVSATVENDAE